MMRWTGIREGAACGRGRVRGRRGRGGIVPVSHAPGLSPRPRGIAERRIHRVAACPPRRSRPEEPPPGDRGPELGRPGVRGGRHRSALPPRGRLRDPPVTLTTCASSRPYSRGLDIAPGESGDQPRVSEVTRLASLERRGSQGPERLSNTWAGLGLTPSVPDLAPRPFQPLTHLLKAKGTGRGQRRGGTGHRGHARAPPLRTLLLCKGPPRSPLDAGRWAGLVTPPGASWGPAIVTRSSPGWPAGGREPPRGEADAPSRQLGPPAPRAATTDAPRRGSPVPCAGWFRVRPVFSHSCPRGHRPPAEGVGGHAQGHAAEERQSGVSQAGLTEPGGRALTPPCGGAGTAPCAEPGLPGWKEGGRCPQRADLCDTGCFGVS